MPVTGYAKLNYAHSRSYRSAAQRQRAYQPSQNCKYSMPDVLFPPHNVLRRNGIELLFDEHVRRSILFFYLLRVYGSADKKIIFKCFF